MIQAQKNNIKNKGLELFYLNIVCNNSKGSIDLLKKSGYKYVPKTAQEAAFMLKHLVSVEKEKGLEKIAMIHPDRELILKSAISNVNKNADGSENFNCSECPKAKTLSVDGEQQGNNMSEKTINKMMIVGASIIALGLITVILTNK